MISKKLLILVLLVPFLFSSCSNDSEIDENSVDTPLNFGNEVSKSFTGQIVDESNIPVANVVITVGNKTANTDRNGVFIINNATVHEKFAFIKARKTDRKSVV